MPRGRQTTKSNRSTRAKKTETALLTVDTFINDKRILDDPPTIIGKAVLLKEYNQEVTAFESILAENFEWFKDLQSKCFDIDEPVSSQAIILENAEAFNEKVASIRKDGSPRRHLIRESQIKSEVLTPEVRANSVVKNNIAEEKQEAQSKEEKLKKEKATPAIPPAGRATRAAKNKTTKNAKPPKFMNTIKKEEIDTKLKEAMIRKQQQDLHKVEKTRQLREEKERKVQENLEQKKKEAEQKAEERRKREEAEEELRRMNLAAKSPGRGRFLGSNTNTPSRNGASPYRLVLPSTPGLARLFPNSTPQRTPGRRPAKLPRVDQLANDIYNAPAHNSPARLVPRKIANGNRPEAMKEVKVEKELIPSAQKHNEEDFRNEQLKLLLQSEEIKPSQEHENCQEKIKVEEEVEQKVEEERKKIEESLKRKAAAIKEEEERNKIEESLRRKEERKAAKRLEEEERLKREEEERKLLEKLKQERAKEEARKQEELRKRDEEKRLKEEEQTRKLMEERLLKERLLAEEEKKLTKQEQKPVNKHLLNATQEMDTGSASENSTYEMTQEKIWIPATVDNYNIEDLSSGDETDDEGAPRKTVPSWAQWTELYKTASKMYQDRDRDFDDMFGGMENPHNQPIFNQAKTKKRARGSSAHWSSPASNPTKGKSRFLGY